MGNLLGRVLPEAFRDVHLPESEPWPRKLAGVLDLNLPSNSDIISYVLRSGPMDKIVGTPKAPGSLDVAQAFYLTEQAEMQKTTSQVVGGEYNYFGSKDARSMTKTLGILCKTNSFMAMALTFRRGYFELKAFDPADETPSLYLKMMRTLQGSGHRVNIVFNSDFSIRSSECFDDGHGKLVKTDDVERAASSAIFNLIFWASSVHGTMHVLHYLLTSALDVASTSFKELQGIAEIYDDNIAVKYLEVALVLIADPVTGKGEDDPAIITGRDGFGSSQAARPILEELLKAWGNSTNTKDLLKLMYPGFSRPEAEKVGLLTEFYKHVDLVEDNYAHELTEAIREISPEKLDDTEAKLKKYLSNCGTFDGSNVANLKSWLEIMAVTGIIHGSTLSYTRLLAMPEVLRWRNIHDENWDKHDVGLLKTALGTIVGIDPGRHVMTSFKNAPDSITGLLDKYDQQTTALKETYQKSLLEDKTLFRDYGYLLTDYCTDNFDGKQLTLTTYI